MTSSSATVILAIICVFSAFKETNSIPLWKQIIPGGLTNCSEGAPYSFYYREGTTNSVVFEFQGGGACWDANTCGLGTFTKTCTPPGDDGIHSASDVRNPFKDWHHLFVPYCTGDAHAGNKTTTYPGLFGDLTINHVGRINALVALDYAFKAAPASPDNVATIGCSAGSLGGLVHAPDVNTRYPKARQLYFGDSYVGVLPHAQFADGFKNWDLTFSSAVPGLAPSDVAKVAADSTIDSGEYIVNQTLMAFPQTQFSSYTSNADSVQTTFFELGGGVGSWTKRMRSLLGRIHTSYPLQYSTFIAAGKHHCVSQDSGFFDVQSDGITLTNWLASVVAGHPSSRAVDCLNDGGNCTVASPPK